MSIDSSESKFGSDCGFVLITFETSLSNCWTLKGAGYLPSLNSLTKSLVNNTYLLLGAFCFKVSRVDKS